MTSPTDPSDSARERRVDEAIARYLELHAAGKAPDRDVWLAQHSDLAADLAAFLDDWDHVRVATLPTAPGNGEGHGEGDADSLTSRTVLAGRYTLIERIGRGGMGEVWVAKQSEPVKRKVAIKLIKSGLDSGSVLARFEAERQALAIMDHPNIARVLDGGVTRGGRPYFVMELVNGLPLNKFCDEARLTPRQRLELFVPICQAVQHAHHKGVVHRDLKPSNILVTLYDGKPVPKVIDFGVAKAIGGKLTDESLSTEFGAVVGTLEYMSPEQAGYSGVDVDTRSDVYSLGVILYELLTGLRPIDAQRLKRAALAQMIRMIQEEQPSKPSARLSTDESLPSLAALRNIEPKRLMAMLRGELDWIVMKCLEKDRNRRYETANGLALDVQRYLSNETVEARPPSTLYRLRKSASRHKAALAAVGAVTIVLLAGLAATSWQAIRATRAERRSTEDAAVATAINDFLQDDLLGLADASSQFGAGLKPDPDIKLRSLLDRAKSRVDARFADQPRIRSEVQATLARSYFQLGRYEESIELWKQVLEFREKTAGVDAPETLEALHRLAVAHRDAGQCQEAMRLDDKLLERLRRTVGPNHRDTMQAVTSLALSQCEAGRTRDAVAGLENNLAQQRRILGVDHADTLATAGSLAEVYKQDGQLEKAVALGEDTLPRRRRLYGAAHPVLAADINNLAVAYAAVGQLGKATPLLEEAYELQLKAQGQEHPDTILALNNLANAYREMGQLDQAVERQVLALELMRKAVGENHPDTAMAMSNLGLTQAALGQFGPAIELHEKALELRRRVLGPEHPSTLVSIENLGHTYGMSGDFDRALRFHEEGLELMRKIDGPEHPDTLRAMSNLGFVLWKTRHLDRSIEVLKETARLQEKALPPNHPNTMRTKVHLANVYGDAGRLEEAVPLAEEAYRKSRGDPSMRWVGEVVLRLYAATGRAADADQVAREMVQVERSTYPADSLPLAAALAKIATPMLPLVECRETESILRECLAIRQKQMPDDWRTFNTQSLLGECLLGQKKYAEAEPLIVAGYEGVKQREEQIPPDAANRLPQALERVVRLYEAWEKPDEAAKWRAKQAPTEAAAPSGP